MFRLGKTTAQLLDQLVLLTDDRLTVFTCSSRLVPLKEQIYSTVLMATVINDNNSNNAYSEVLAVNCFFRVSSTRHTDSGFPVVPCFRECYLIYFYVLTVN